MPEQEQQEDQGFKAWVILEIMGHRRLAGYVTETRIAGKDFLQLNVPVPTRDKKEITQFYPPESVYCITPTTEEIARAVAARNQPEPIHPLELPAPRTPLAPPDDDDVPF